MHKSRMMRQIAMTRAWIWLGLLFALLASGPAQAVDLLEPEEAFKVTAEVVDNDRVEARFEVADEYYLYQDRLGVTSLSDGVRAGPLALPPGIEKNDEFFGDVVVYKKDFTAEVPLEGAAGQTVELKFDMQGCAEAGVCYPPQSQTVSLTLPVAESQSGGGLAGLRSLADEIDGGLDAGAANGEPLDPEVAFRPEALLEGDTVHLRWEIAPGYYMYRDRVEVGLAAEGASVGRASIPEGELKDDPNFGQMWVFHDQMEATVPISRSPENREATLVVSHQGCADMGLCYPPMEDVWVIDFPAGTIERATELPDPPPTLRAIVDLGSVGPADQAPATAATAGDQAPQSEQDAIVAQLASGNVWLVILTFFVIGLLLSLTPCVFPMIPILAGIIAGQGDQVTMRRAFIMSVVYVLAMALTYTVAGVLAGLFGANLQATFQNPWILSAFAAIFVALALSMFGFYELQLPSSLQSKVMEVQNRQKGGTLTGVAVMGFLSALIVGPCMAPPLAGALIYIGQTGDAVLGGAALFAMSLGMGVLLIAVGTLGGKFLPRAGNWMNAVKAVFGVLLLGVAIWMLERILPTPVVLLMWSTLAIVSAIYMGALEPIREGATGWARLWKGLGVILLLWGALMLIAVAAGGKGSPLTPLAGLSLGGGGSGESQAELSFTVVKNEAELDAQLAEAQAQGQPVMLDFYADWCISCKEMESFTFSDPEVIAALEGVRLLKADVTKNNEDDKALLKRFDLFGPPGIIFYDESGAEQPGYRVVGFMPADRFREQIREAIGR
ncbi:MAG: protein-disulfide reductase DsbD [Halothiobacillaceae bacterium]